MRKLAVALCLLSRPALATGLEIDVEGEAQGTIVIDLLEEVAPQHVERITTLAAVGRL
jgi:peptidylprolyl isomerase